MKASSLALCAAGLLAGVAARAQTPYVETTTLNFFWGFTLGYQTVSGSTAPAMPDVATLDPETLPVGYNIYTDTVKPRAYTGPVNGHFPPSGSNADLIKMLLQRAVRDGQLVKETITDDYRWELIAVREAPKNVKELATNPYRVFLCGQFKLSSSSSPIVEVTSFGSEVVPADPLPPAYLDTDPSTPDEVTVDTGLTLTLGQFSGNYTESKWEGDRVRTASGSVATAFTVNFGALYYEDPLHAQKDPTPNEEKPDEKFNYHLKRNYWRASASGLINYSIRSTPAPLPTFIASSASATANGWFLHERDETVYDKDVPKPSDDILKTYGYGGIAPLRLSMSTIQYQKRDRFPALRPPTAPTSLSATASSATAVSLSWFDSSVTEESFSVERRTGASGAWAVIDTITGNTATARGPENYDDTTVSAETTYFYRVRAFNAANGYSSYTDQVKVVTPAADPAP